MRRTNLSLTFSYIRTFIINFTKIDLMIGPVIVVIMIVTLVTATKISILTPIRVISLNLGIKFSTISYPLVIRVIPTFMRGMGLATNLTFNHRPLILLELYLRLGLIYTSTFMLPFGNTQGNTPFCIGEQIRLMGLLINGFKWLGLKIQIEFMTATVRELVSGQKITNCLVGLFDLSQT